MNEEKPAREVTFSRLRYILGVPTGGIYRRGLVLHVRRV